MGEMKKLIALVLALVCVVGLVGCKPDGATDLIELGEVSAFVSEKGYTAEDFKEKLTGQYYEDIIHSWGEADIQFSGFWGHSWYLDDNNDKYISLYYDENGYVEAINIGSNTDIAPTDIEPIDYPPMVMFNDILYTATSYSGDKEDLSVVGKIESYIDYGVPTENNQANDTLVGCEIYITSSAPDFIFVLNNGVYSPYKSTDGAGIE